MRESPPRLMVLLEGGDVHPSGVVRALIYKERLEHAGWNVVWRNRRLPALAALVHRPPRWLAPITTRGLGRLVSYALMEAYAWLTEWSVVSAAKHCDVVFLCKIKSLKLVRRLRSRTTAKIVLDFGDAVWRNKFASGFDEILKTVDEVTTDNEYTATYVRQFNDCCTVVPDPPQVEAFDAVRAQWRRKSTSDDVTLGWIGSPTAAHNLDLIWPVLKRLFEKYPRMRLRLAGADVTPPLDPTRVSIRPAYDQRSMIEEVLQFDIGLFPMFDNEESLVRGVLKATVYMSGEAVAICSPIGQVKNVVRDGDNGMLATEAEWEGKLSRLIEDSSLRARIAARGLETARRDFSIDASFAILNSVLQRQLQ